MAVDVNKLIITEVAQIMAFNNADELEFILDEVQDGTVSNTEEKSDVTGRNGRKIATIKKNKAVTISANNGLIVGGAIAAQSGTSVEYGTFKVRYTDVMKVTSNAATTEKVAVGTVGAEVGTVYVKNANGSLGKKFTQVASDAELKTGEFTYDGTNALVFFDGDLADGTEIAAFYDIEVSDAAKISNDSEKYSKTLKVIADVVCQDNCDNQYFAQLLIPRGDVSGNFDIQLGGDNKVQAIEIESLAGGCSGSTKLWDLIVYGE